MILASPVFSLGSEVPFLVSETHPMESFWWVASRAPSAGSRRDA
jgi:hypothetical protein